MSSSSSSSPPRHSAETWIPPRTPHSARVRDLPFRRTHRAPIAACGLVVQPGHPGRAAFDILDVCAEGLFLADEDLTLEREASVRIGLPAPPAVRSGHSSASAVWAWARVRWRGEKDGRRGVGVKLTFDDEAARRAWRRSVAQFMEARLAPTP